MTKIVLLERLKDETETAIADLLMPVRMQKEDNNVQPPPRPAAVYLMRLPEMGSTQKKAPYIIHQVVTGRDVQEAGSPAEASAVVRTIFCVYNDKEDEGGLMLLNLMERLRIYLLEKVVVGEQFRLDLTQGVETLIYPDDTAPYYMGEMISTWGIPRVRREVNLYG
jgi:hypothetical protein